MCLCLHGLHMYECITSESEMNHNMYTNHVQHTHNNQKSIICNRISSVFYFYSHFCITPIETNHEMKLKCIKLRLS